MVFPKRNIGYGALCLLAGVVSAWPAFAQGLRSEINLGEFGASTDSSLSGPSISPLFTIGRSSDSDNSGGVFANQTITLNLGLEARPVENLNLIAGAWRLQMDNEPSGTPLVARVPDLYIERPSLGNLNEGQSGLPAGIKTSGIDLGASYVFETNETGQFTLSTKVTYVYDFRQISSLIDEVSDAALELPGSADLQGNLTLSWDFGNHNASATTNYFDSFKDLNELDLEEINRLVDDIVTFDLQYGYSVRTGKQERAVFSFGIRNIFDKKTTQILNNNSRVVDQNGRVAYGSIKYQF